MNLAHAGQSETIAWLVERTIDGRPHWLRWHDYDERVWVTDANIADHYPSWIPAARDARHLTAMGEPCEATEHMFIGVTANVPGGQISQVRTLAEALRSAYAESRQRVMALTDDQAEAQLAVKVWDLIELIRRQVNDDLPPYFPMSTDTP